MNIRIGIIREEKQPADKRVAFTPAQCAELKLRYPRMEILMQPSPDRCFPDALYTGVGVVLSEDLSNCDYLFGIKEVPADKLLEGKTYLFFSHTIKKQPHNRPLMQALIRKKIRLIDYETLRWKNGDRILGFGRFAGVVGAYNGLLTWGRKYKTFEMKPAWQCSDYAELRNELKNLKMPPVKILLTGNGRVSLGALELLKEAGIRQVTPSDILTKLYAEPVFAVLLTEHLYERIDGKPYDRSDFHHDPTRYRCVFRYYLPHCDLLINGIYWDDKMDRLFSEYDTRLSNFRPRVIADISCDVKGGVPITLKDTKIFDPVFGYDPASMSLCPPYQENTIDVMAVSNLPTELPRDASEGFGAMLLDYVLPELLKPDSPIIENATICSDGKLMKDYEYLTDYAC